MTEFEPPSTTTAEASVHELSKTGHVEVMTNLHLLSTSELAELLRVPARTLEAWRLRGYGPRYIRLGKHVMYRPEDVEHFLDDATVETGAARA